MRTLLQGLFGVFDGIVGVTVLAAIIIYVLLGLEFFLGIPILGAFN